MFKVEKVFVLLIVALLIFSCKTTEETETETDAGPLHPEQVENLIMPPGFDNDYVAALKNMMAVEVIKPVIRIMDFEVPGSFRRKVRNEKIEVEELLKSEIARTGRFTLLGSEDDIMAVMEEQRKIGDDAFDESEGPELGYLKIAGYTLVGKITHSIPDVTQEGGARYSLKVKVGVSLTMTNATSGEIEYTKVIEAVNEELLFVSAEGMIIKGPRNLTDKPLNSLRATGSDIDLVPQYMEALNEAIRGTVYFLEEKHPIMGEVIGVNGNEVVTTAAMDQGLKSGDYLFILRVGEPMEDSLGRVLGYSKTMIGAVKVTAVEKNLSTGEIVKLKNENAAPLRGDIIISLPAIVGKE